jgi:hypothetical protein
MEGLVMSIVNVDVDGSMSRPFDVDKGWTLGVKEPEADVWRKTGGKGGELVKSERSSRR